MSAYVNRPVITVEWAPCDRPTFATSGRWNGARITYNGVLVRELRTCWNARERAAFAARVKACTTLQQVKEIT